MSFTSTYSEQDITTATEMFIDLVGMMSVINTFRQISQFDNDQFDRKYITPENKELVEMEVKSWCKSENISPNIIQLATKLWVEDSSGKFPTLETLVKYFDDRCCLCLRGYPDNDRHGLIQHFLVTFGRMPLCQETEACMIFNNMEHRFPNQDELSATIERITHMVNDPEGLYNKDKKIFPTSNLDYIKSCTMEEKETFCTLCQEQIDTGKQCYKLIPCNHVFHADAKDCLGECSIISWLKNNRTCPVCKSEVVIEKPKEK